MSVESIPSHGNPNGKLFGVIGETSVNDDGEFYIKSGSEEDTLNVGWMNIPIPSVTPTTTTTPSITPTRTPIVTRNLTPVNSPTNTPTPTPTPSSTQYLIYTRTPTPTPTNTPTITITNTATVTPTLTATLTPTPTNSETPTPTPTSTSPTPTPTPTPTATVTPTISVTPSPTLPYFTLTTNSSGNGTLWPYENGTVIIPAGTQVAVYAEPDSNYNYSSFSVIDIPGAVSSSITYSDGIYGTCQFTMPYNDCSITANFVLQNKTLQTGVNGSGTVSPSSGPYSYGTNVSLIATPVTNNGFSHWVFGGTSNPSDGSTSTATSNIYMTDNRTAVAYFLPLKAVYANVNSIGNWSVTFKNSSGNVVTESGTAPPQFFNSQITVSCGTVVYSGGGLLDIPCGG